GRTGVGRDSLARAVLTTADELLARFPDHPQAADLTWREANLAFAHGWLDRAAADFGRMAERHPTDPRAPRASILKADALFRDGKFEAAGGAYEQALVASRRAGADSLTRRAEQAIPVAYHRLAEASVAEDSSRHDRHAALFQQVATRWPRYEHAHLAQYRAGLAWAKAGQPRDAVRAFQAVIDSFPRSAYVRDAQLEIARTWEAAGEKEPSAAAYARFAERYPKDAGAADAWLKAADLYAAAGKDDQALEIRLAYVKRYPNDIETAMEVYEGLAKKELAAVGPGHPVSKLLPPPAPAPAKKGAKRAAAKPKPAAPAGPPSALAEYLKRAKLRPDLASRDLLAQVTFLEAEEARPAYEALRIRQPLPKSIAAKQKSLDALMAGYKKSVDRGVPEWAHASTFRIGEALVTFGEALEKSERPADLQGDALHAYEEVLHDRAVAFAQRGEDVWADLLKQKSKDAKDDPWLARAQEALWKRLGDRFFFVPEVDYPLVSARPAERQEIEKDRTESAEKKLARRESDRAGSQAGKENRP
ncbi:MAG TPA: tetratricopeptide repeat protein, partial [Candidatus Eisenbacteria bacterium]|nr:tetratricopeptide repeat protein [Candidatus Eisenbacteria bacterium]